MDFGPKITRLHNQEDVDEYLEKYGIELSPGIKVEFCPPDTKFVLSPPDDGVYRSWLGLKLSLTKFVRNVLTFYQIAPS